MRRLLVILAALVAALLAAELVCRLVSDDPIEAAAAISSSWRVEGLVSDPELAYSFQPGYSGRMVLRGEYDVPFRINAQGLRDDADVVPGHPGTTRILLLGDSFVFGVGVPFADTLGEQLERALQDAGPVEVVAAGVPGYAPDDYALLAERWVPRLHPDLVVVGFFTGNDILDCDAKRADPKQVVEGFLVSRRQAWSYELRKYSVLGNLLLARFNPHARTEELRPANPTPAQVEDLRRSLRPWLARLAGVSADGGPPVVVFLIHGKDYLATLQRSGSAYRIKGLEEICADLRRLGVAVLDPLEALQAGGVAVERWYFQRDAHFTAEGSRFVAGWLASELRERFAGGATVMPAAGR